jgi:hypothetical protein
MRARNLTGRRMLVLVALVAVGAAACGSSSKSATSDTPTTLSTSAASPTSAASSGTPTTAKTEKVSGNSNSNFCELARNYTDASGKEVATETPPELKKLYSSLLPKLKQAEDIAPSQIKGDFATFVTFFKQLDSTLAAAQYNFENLSPTALQSLDTPAIEAASQHISAYMTQVCHITTPTT